MKNDRISAAIIALLFSLVCFSVVWIGLKIVFDAIPFSLVLVATSFCTALAFVFPDSSKEALENLWAGCVRFFN